jgi:hypothetical protein
MMTGIISTKELERKAFRSTFQDGLWDIYLGVLLFLVGGGAGLARVFHFDIITINLILVLVAVAAIVGFFMGKKFITVPRLGQVKFGPERRAKIKKVTMVLSLSALVGLWALVAYRFTSSIGTLPSWVVPFGLFAVMSVSVFSLAAYHLDYRRAYFYGWCYALAFPVSILLEQFTQYGFLISYLFFSGTMIVPGVILLRRFVRDYPVQAGIPEDMGE